MEERESSAGFDRRRFIKGAATVAWATPLVLSLAGTAHAQVPSPGGCLGSTGRPEFCPCTTSAQCAQGCCCALQGMVEGACTSGQTCIANTPPGQGVCLG
jgi:hypothetical protein